MVVDTEVLKVNGDTYVRSLRTGRVYPLIDMSKLNVAMGSDPDDEDEDSKEKVQ